MKQIKIFYSESWTDYELLDTGEGEKLEHFGSYTFVRPLEDAFWSKTLSQKEWDKANGKFWSSKVGAKAGWKMQGKIEEKWKMSCKNIKFLAREVKRGNKYDAIIMDPPKFGRGPKGEIWKLEVMLPKLLAQVQKVLSDKPLFVILTSYGIDSSSLTLGYALADMMKNFTGDVEAGELCVLEKSNNRLISLANTAVWSVLSK